MTTTHPRGNMVAFHFRHAILLVVFFVMSIARNVQYVYNKLCLRIFSMTYYPNKSPQIIRDDVSKLGKLPKRISCIVSLRSDDDENGGCDGVMGDVAELAAWCLSAGVPSLTVYEYNGCVKSCVAELQNAVTKNLRAYFGLQTPSFTIKVPHTNEVVSTEANSGDADLEIAVLLRVDGKPTIVELARTIGELTASKELLPDDITVKLIDGELTELVGPEPDLLICFGPVLDLQDYPPWHLRLTEMYWEPDNNSVNYAVFIRALKKFAQSRVNLGK
ncbi:hypothetical protein PUMCH_001661 [Australozyma saopauloensis]|uniref:ditrans,polycis-polyprenyl diphosphate synthase [(2E,6E)-farnesyldiphosphate specific] n=1 Tax=Australozyma saopauloensis TaxID=291208 RepID=A0AAX4H7C9_9ASCO|nr:hypothetical protein PUMCH_001661 [[Candida] saopauloensis]